MTIFDKCDAYTMARVAQAEGIYPYFTPVEQSTATEVRVHGEWKVMVGSNNYLGLTHHPRVLEAQRRALEKYGSGATGSRLLNGTIDLHDELEQRFAAFYGKEAALVFTTGYQASLGAVATFEAARFWRALFDVGVFAHPIVPPAVPANASRIRVSMSAEHTDEQVDRVLDAF